MIPSKERITAIDFARALAIFGMIIVNYKLAMLAEDGGPAWLQAIAGLFEGRSSALFVLLAGIGVSLMTSKARFSKNEELIRHSRTGLYRRAAFLFIAGLLLLLLGWSADILHNYAVFMLVAAVLITVSDNKILGLFSIIVLVSQFFLVVFDYSKGWDPSFKEYAGIWTLEGFARNLLFNGFHPIFPWLSFFLIGTKPMPPTMLYVFSGICSAVSMIAICLYVVDKFEHSILTQAVINTGQLSLSHYIGHVVLGLGLLETAGYLGNGNLSFAIVYGVVYFMIAVAFSYMWRKWMKQGPLELIMRKLC